MAKWTSQMLNRLASLKVAYGRHDGLNKHLAGIISQEFKEVISEQAVRGKLRAEPVRTKVRTLLQAQLERQQREDAINFEDATLPASGLKRLIQLAAQADKVETQVELAQIVHTARIDGRSCYRTMDAVQRTMQGWIDEN